MKKILMLSLSLPFLLASCKSVKMVSNKKLPESAPNAVIRAQNVEDAHKTMNPEIPLEEHAYVMPADNIKMAGLYGRILVYPPGEQDFRLKSEHNSFLLNELLAQNITTSFEPGEYYSYNAVNNTFRTSLLGGMEFYVLTDETRLERAKQYVADIKEYLEYMKNHPNALDGTYDHRVGKLIIKESRLYFSKIKGIEILFDGETIILLDDDDKYKLNNPYNGMPSIWYYRFNTEGNLELMMNANQILSSSPVNVVVFKPVPENP